MHVPTSNSFFSFKTEAINANHRCKLKRNSLAFQWDQNRYDRSYELRVIPDLVGAAPLLRKCTCFMSSSLALKLFFLSFSTNSDFESPTPNNSLSSHASDV